MVMQLNSVKSHYIDHYLTHTYPGEYNLPLLSF